MAQGLAVRQGGRLARLIAATGTFVAVLVWAGPAGEEPTAIGAGEDPPRPNFVVIDTDDQTVAQLTRRTMPFTFRKLHNRGTRFTNSIVTTPLCCPSRASLLTGQYAHNHLAWNSYKTFEDPSNMLARWLGRAGYRTAMVGKYLNHYDSTVSPVTRPEKGWDQWRMLLPPMSYYDYAVSENGKRVRRGDRDRDYQTSYLNREATGLARRWSKGSRPFFVWLTPHAPHAEKGRSARRCGGKMVPGPRDEELFRHAKLPRPRSFNEAKISDKPRFIRRVRKLDREAIAKLTELHRCRLASLREVDRGVKMIYSALKRTGGLNETIILFTSDNGVLQGEHRLKGGKRLPYDEAVEVPMVARIPNRALGGQAVGRVGRPVANIDIAPTLLELAGAAPCEGPGDCRVMDGRSLVPLLRGSAAGWPSERGLLMENYNCRFRALRAGGRVAVIHKTVALNPGHSGCRRRNEFELYGPDDPHQLRNTAQERDDIPTDLRARLGRLRRCTGIEGRDPAPADGQFYCE